MILIYTYNFIMVYFYVINKDFIWLLKDFISLSSPT